MAEHMGVINFENLDAWISAVKYIDMHHRGSRHVDERRLHPPTNCIAIHHGGRRSVDRPLKF